MIAWTSKTNHVDKDTGEIIEKKELTNYIKIKTYKEYAKQKPNNGRPSGYIEYTTEYRRKPKQGNLF